MNDFLQCIIEGGNYPPEGKIVFDSSDHVRFQKGQAVSGHNFGCKRRIVVERNVEVNEGYTITIYNLDGIHPLWQNNIQMAPKRMKIVSVDGNIVEMRGFGYDQLGGFFADYGISILIEEDKIARLQLNMFDRNISIIYLH